MTRYARTPQLVQPVQQQPVRQQPTAQQQPVQQSTQPVQQPVRQQPTAQQQPVQQPTQPVQQQPVQQQPVRQQPTAQQQPVQQPTQPASEEGQFQGLESQQEIPSTSPFVDIYDSPEELTVFADVPGTASGDVRLEGDDRMLRIIAERQPAPEEEDLTPIQQERLRRIERTIQLPDDVDVEEAEATCEDGVCSVKLPKAEKRTIGVQ